MTTFFADSGGIGSLFVALGINWRGLILNAVAFLIIVWLLGKFVYPHLIKALDNKQGEMEAAVRMEHEARLSLEKAEKSADAVLSKARASADEIIATAHADAAAQLDEARTKAAAQAERIVTEAREQLGRDVQAARRELKAETAKLVASAAGAVLDEKLDGGKDAALINRSLEAK
jgi:F-type H+-transporting ATPase subunit b